MKREAKAATTQSTSTTTKANTSDTMSKEQFQAQQTNGILQDLNNAPKKTVSHAYGDESATSLFDAFGRVSREKSANYDNAAREHAESRKVGSMLLQGVHRLLNGKRVAPAQQRLITPDLVERVRLALDGQQPTMENIAEALRKVSASV